MCSLSTFKLRQIDISLLFTSKFELFCLRHYNFGSGENILMKFGRNKPNYLLNKPVKYYEKICSRNNDIVVSKRVHFFWPTLYIQSNKHFLNFFLIRV